MQMCPVLNQVVQKEWRTGQWRREWFSHKTYTKRSKHELQSAHKSARVFENSLNSNSNKMKSSQQPSR